jgi:hypothetical protein
MVDASNEGGQPLKLTDVAEMVGALDFNEVQFYGLSITYRDSAVDDGEDDAEGSVGVSVNTSIRTRNRGIDYRMHFSLPHPNGDVAVDAAALFDAADDVTFEEEAVLDFGDDVAMMALFPYIRQAVNDLGLRIGIPIVLPIIKRGDLSFRQSKQPSEG